MADPIVPQTGNYINMQNRINDEVLGAITTQQIVNAVQDAIAKYERKRFWFNEQMATYVPGDTLDGTPGVVLDSYIFPNFSANQELLTVPGQEFYSLNDNPFIGSCASISKMVLVQGGSNRYSLRPRTPQWMDDNSTGLTWRGMPTDWAYEAQQFRFYPIPDAAYPIQWFGTFRFDPMVNPTDSNPWVVEAEELIRMSAEAILYRRILRDQSMAQMASQDEAQALKSLNEETTRRRSTGRLRGSSWF